MGARGEPAGTKQLATAKTLARDGDLDGAINAARGAIATNGHLVEAYLLVGSLCAAKRNLDCAGTIYGEGIQAVPQAPELHHAQGMLNLERGDLDSAVRDLEEANSLSASKNPDIMADLAYAYVFVSRLDEAQMLAAASRRLAPKSFAAAFTHGEVLMRKKKFKDAIEAYDAAVALDPDEIVAKRRLASALANHGDLERSLSTYESILVAAKNDPRIYAGAAGVLLRLGRGKDALASMKTAIELAPKSVQLWQLLLHVQEETGDKRGARKSRIQIDKLEKGSK